MNYAEFIGKLGRNEDSDECYTPEDEVKAIFPFLDKEKTYYEATSGISSAIVNSFTRAGYNMVGSGGKNFFDCSKDEIYDRVVTNPPYSKKDDFIFHCYEIGKPFALLLPVATIQGQKRGKKFKELGISMLVYNKRIDFTGNKAPPFGV